MDWKKDSVRSSVSAPEFNMKHLKKAKSRISRNVLNIKIKDEDNNPNTLNDRKHEKDGCEKKLNQLRKSKKIFKSGCPRSVMVKERDNGIVMSEFELQ